MKITGIICCLALLCTACSEEKTELPWGSDNYIVSFSLTTGADTYPAVIRDGRITVSIPYNVSLEDAQVSYELCEHASIYPDPATVADWDQEWQFLVSSYDNQNDRTYLYTVERTDIATDGSLTLRTQAEVDAFARSGINTVEGNLTIGGEDEENPVTNLDGLKNLVSVRCDLTITAAYTGETLAGLENLTACESLRIGSAAHPNETLRQLSLPALKEIKGDLCVYGTALQTADFKSLQSVAGHFVLQSDALLQLTADELTTVAGNMTLIGTTADEAKAPCEQMYFPKLQRIDGTLTLSRFDRLSGLGTTFGVLTQAGALRYEHLALANTFEFPLIETTGNITVTDCPILRSVLLPALTDAGSLEITGCPAIETLSFPKAERFDGDVSLNAPRDQGFRGIPSGAQSHFRRPVDRRPVVARRRTGSLGMHFFSEQYARPASGRRDATDGAPGRRFRRLAADRRLVADAATGSDAFRNHRVQKPRYPADRRIHACFRTLFADGKLR